MQNETYTALLNFEHFGETVTLIKGFNHKSLQKTQTSYKLPFFSADKLLNNILRNTEKSKKVSQNRRTLKSIF